jgi:hypothetical protein
MSRLILGFIGISSLLAIYVASSVKWSHEKILKKKCFLPQSLALPNALKYTTPPLWEISQQLGVPQESWNIPYSEKPHTQGLKKYSISVDFEGYLYPNNYEEIVSPFNKYTIVNYTGNAVISKFSVFEEAFNNVSSIPSLEVEIDDGYYLVSIFYVPEKLRQMYIDGPCYALNQETSI